MMALQSESYLFVSKATVLGKLNMNGLHVGQGLYAHEEARFAEVDLGAAHIEGALDLSEATVSGKLDMNGLYVGEGLFMRQTYRLRRGAGSAEEHRRGV